MSSVKRIHPLFEQTAKRAKLAAAAAAASSTPTPTSSPLASKLEENRTPARSTEVATPQGTPAKNDSNGTNKQLFKSDLNGSFSSSTTYSPRQALKEPPRSTTKVQPAMSSSRDDHGHAHLNYKFLYPPKRRDINHRAPDDPDYDEKTLYVPDDFLNSQTPALRQWWLIKQRNMDAILFFKMGKFYELFNEDAVLGVNHLDIIYMKGEEGRPAHAGFPEVSFNKYASILINKGFKVLRVEQTETPAMMEERCQTTGRKGKFDKVVKREVCQVTTKGTQMMGVSDSVFHSSQNQYLLAVYQSSNDNDEKKTLLFGVCFIDVTIGKLHIGQFEDDRNLSNFNILLAHHTPTEILYERNNLSQEAYQAILKTGALLTSLKADREFWTIKKTLSHLKTHKIFTNESDNFEWPNWLRGLFEGDDDNLLNCEPLDRFRFGLNSFGALVYYLNAQLIEGQVLKCATFDVYETPLRHSQSGETNLRVPAMIMDHIALKNLEIFADSAGGTGATLYNSINNCKTHFGQRLLKNWLCSPLCDIKQLNNRLDAVEALISNRNTSLMNEIIHILGQTPDLERMLSKIKSQCFKSEGDLRAIMFDGDQHSKAKISSFLNLLNNFKRLQKFIASIKSTINNCESDVLKRLLSLTTDGGLFPDYSATLEYFEGAFDHRTAQQTGKIIPSPGVDSEYDQCEENIQKIKSKLDDYLEGQKRILNCRQIEYFGSAKNRYQIQVPEAYCKKVPSDYRIETTRKGFKRYYTPKIDEYFSELTIREEEMKKILDNIMSKIFEQFARKMNLWTAAIECINILDVLQSIATFVRSLKASGIDVCRPEYVPESGSSRPFVEYVNGRHPALVRTDPNFIPNDLLLDDRLILLSGANMGGKSTLMRQTALIVILAQIGSYVPASSLRLTPVDRIFSRLGASDRLLDGESTFYTELVETSSMLRCATKNSLILLDELGRGTSTYDGTAIAYSVIKEVSSNLKCRCLFSTHYHTLNRDFINSEDIRLAHMACKIEHAESNDAEMSLDPLKENLSFLYKITEGPAARSYGFNVAKLAGINNDIIRDAFTKAKEIESSCKILSALQKVSLSGEVDDKDNLKNKIKDILSSQPIVA